MRKTRGKYGVICVLVLVLLLSLLATAGSAPARGAPSFTWYGGFYDQVDAGDYHADTPAVGNATQLPLALLLLDAGAPPAGRGGAVVLVPLRLELRGARRAGSDYATDPESVIPGWHYHWGTGIVSTELPNYTPPFAPPKATWLWTTKLAGFTTPAGVHYITETWTGCNKYKGLKALCTWTMRQADFQDATGKVWILR